MLIDKIKLLVSTGYDIGITQAFQLTHDSRAYHSAVTCYINLRVLFHFDYLRSLARLLSHIK